MKIALLFSGQPRCFEYRAYQSIKHFFLDKYDCDVYAHFWFSDDVSTKYETAPYSGLGDITFTPDTIQRFTDLYHPTKLSYDQPLEKTIVQKVYTKTPHPSVPYNIISKYTSLQRVFNLVENVHQYDFIICLRSDTVILNIPDLRSLDTNKIHITALGGHNEKIFQHDFHIVPPKFAHYFYNSITMLDTWYEKGFEFLGEYFFLALIDEYNLKSYLHLLPFAEFNMALQRTPEKIDICRDQE